MLASALILMLLAAPAALSLAALLGQASDGLVRVPVRVPVGRNGQRRR